VLAAGLLVIALVGVASAGPGSNQVSIGVAEEIGILSTTHTTATASYTRRLWTNRAYVEGRFGLGTSGNLLFIEERVGAGFVFAPSHRVELLVGWRLGDSYLRGEINSADFAINLLAVELAIELVVSVKAGWQIRAAPLVPTLFWNKTYGGALGLELGVGHAF
jgi:hypothetical protein